MPTVLFLCPHHAAKSVIAEAYCQRLASAEGLELNVNSAGTEPDEAVMPSVADLLEMDGLSVRHHRPRTVTRDDLECADVIVSLGCDLDALGVPMLKRRDWRDIPPASADVVVCRSAILERLRVLLTEFRAPQSTRYNRGVGWSRRRFGQLFLSFLELD